MAEKLGLLKVEGIEGTGVIIEKPPERAIIETAQELGEIWSSSATTRKRG